MSSLNSIGNQEPWRAHTVRVGRVIAESPGVATYELAFTNPAIEKTFRFSPGQFNMLYVPGLGESAISISSRPESPEALQHTIRSVGGVTKAIEAGGRGMLLGLRGPFGSSWPIDACLQESAEAKEVVIVAGGIGMAPLRSAVYVLSRHRRQLRRMVVLIGARSPEDLLFRDEYSEWEQQGIEVHSTVDRVSAQWQGNIGVVTTLLNRLSIAQPDNVLVLTCGPEVMMRYVVQSALQRRIPSSNIWISLERNMNCAVGLCGHCQLGPEFLCKDGPVLPYNRVAAWLNVHSF